MTKKIGTFSKSPKTEAAKGAASPAAVESFLESSAMVGRDPAEATTPAASLAVTGQAARTARASTTADLDENSVYRTVNVKLNKRRYTNLKLLSAMTETSMQQYLVELVDELIERNKDMLPTIKSR